MLTVSTLAAYGGGVPAVPIATPQRKRRNAYHHGNLRQALVDQAVATIRARGVDALTLREVGAGLRVSRTALYRHFADKQSLLAAVATQGFRAFRDALLRAWDGAGRGRDGFLAMGRAYIRFALENPPYYRVMFGDYLAAGADTPECDEPQAQVRSELAAEGQAAFQVLVDALIELQQAGLVRAGDPLDLAVFVWASVHGTAMLAIGGQLTPGGRSIESMAAAAVGHVWDALVPAPPRP